VALAEVSDETCTMCRLRVRPQIFQELRKPGSHEIVHCGSCTRILYYAGEPVTPPSAQPVAQGRES
jgi:predicted  nucleic acid-binding Zn-ribbon protein